MEREIGSEAELVAKIARVKRGGAEKYHRKLRGENKLFVRERLRLLLDSDSFIENHLLANVLNEELPADGVVTGTGQIDGRTVCFMANDSTVKAGSWGARTVRKIIEIQEKAATLRVPIFYLVDSAGGRITDQIEMFPGRLGAGRIFRNQVILSGLVPQICLLFGPSAAGGAYIPAFCDVVIMVEGNASMYLGSPRMAEMVIFEETTLEEMGGARMHCTVSGCGDVLVQTEEEAIDAAKRYFSYFPQSYQDEPPKVRSLLPRDYPATIEALIPTNQNVPFDMYELIHRLIDRDSFFEVKQLYAPEVITGFARLGGLAVGIVASQSNHLGGVLFVNSADKATRFIQLCDAFDIPLLFLMDVPGFMIGKEVEREGIIRAGAHMISAVAEATVPKISVVVRKAYGAGLYAMCGPAFDPDACLALPTAQIAIMGPEAAINAVYYNKIMELEGRAREKFIEERRREYQADIDIYKLASEMVVDAIVPPSQLRDELIARFVAAESKRVAPFEKKHAVYPV